MKQYEPVIGLEIHVELKTKSKMFCQCPAGYFGKPPNSQTCPVCLALPGALPVPNRKAVEWTILIGMALNCTINRHSKFDRKHYFYPDLPKGYQISQYDEPIAVNGRVTIKTKYEGNEENKGKYDQKTFRIRRVHLEEDTGKLLHEGASTHIDFNRSGVPLVEIVTEPDFNNADDARIFLEELHTIIEFLDVSDADMEKGSMRLEPNISLRKIGDQRSNSKNEDNLPKYKVEVKNINSFNFVKKAVEYELKRQAEILESGQMPAQETRGYDEKSGTTYSQRSKEEAHDYRYFPEPDIPPLEFSQKYLDEIKSTLPELPSDKFERYIGKDSLKVTDAFILSHSKELAHFYEAVRQQSAGAEIKPQTFANLIINKKIPTDISPAEFAKRAVELSAPVKTDTTALQNVIATVIARNEKAVNDYRNGKENALMFLLGQVMREMKGKADANVVGEELKKAFKK